MLRPMPPRLLSSAQSPERSGTLEVWLPVCSGAVDLACARTTGARVMMVTNTMGCYDQAIPHIKTPPLRRLRIQSTGLL
jgi:hypothetical protein